jgi:putative hydrolase of the HAD superfamily
MIRAVSLDLWNTLLWDTPDMETVRTARRFEGILATLAEAGRRVDRADLERAYSACGRTMQEVQSQHLDLTIHRQVATFLECLDPALPGALSPGALEAIIAHYADVIVEIPPRLVEGAETLLPALKAVGYRVALVSNTGRSPGRSLRRVLDRAGLLDHFDVLTFSDEAEASKPGAAIFARTLGHLGGLAPEQVVHVGDDPVLDVLGGRNAGLRVVHFTPARSPEWAAWALPPHRAPDRRETPMPDATLTRLADLPDLLSRL